MKDIIQKQEKEIAELRERLECGSETSSVRYKKEVAKQNDYNHAEIIEELENRLARNESAWQEKFDL